MADVKPSPVAGSNEMVERVARAIYVGTVVKNGGFHPRYERRGDGFGWREYTPEEITAYEDQNCKYFETEARAAIAVLRGPTTAMGLAGYKAWDAFGEDATMGPVELLAVYRAMIDAALIEPNK